MMDVNEGGDIRSQAQLSASARPSNGRLNHSLTRNTLVLVSWKGSPICHMGLHPIVVPRSQQPCFT